MKTTADDVIKSATGIARDAAEGRLSPAELDQAVAAECRTLFGQVVGDGDPLWPLHRDVTRQSIALGALSADELSEWVAVLRRREQQNRAVGAAETTETPDGLDVPADPESVASGAHSPDNRDADAEPEGDTEG